MRHHLIAVFCLTLLLSVVLVELSYSGDKDSITGPQAWYTYRNDTARTGAQPYASALSDPKAVKNLAVRWVFPSEGKAPGYFSASPIVARGTVFIGSSAGYFYAIDEKTGKLKWQYPNPPDPSLVSPASAPSKTSYGIGSSASFWDRDAEGVVEFWGPGSNSRTKPRKFTPIRAKCQDRDARLEK
jgi:outer membrane protein assembly factor BamB